MISRIQITIIANGYLIAHSTEPADTYFVETLESIPDRIRDIAVSTRMTKEEIDEQVAHSSGSLKDFVQTLKNLGDLPRAEEEPF